MTHGLATSAAGVGVLGRAGTRLRIRGAGHVDHLLAALGGHEDHTAVVGAGLQFGGVRSAPDAVEKSVDKVLVHAADELGVALGQFVEWTVPQPDGA